MTLTDFLTRLAETGVGVVQSEVELSPGDGWEAVIRSWEAAQRAEMAYGAPELSLRAAEWAALRLYRGCQALICREMPPAELQRFLAHPCPESRSPAVDYSVDLLFRFLPDLFKWSQKVSNHDPLVEELLVLARAWPLSSVGIANLGSVDPSPVLAHPGLLQLYIDRVIATGDLAPLEHPDVRRAVRASLGAYPELAPDLATRLATFPS